MAFEGDIVLSKGDTSLNLLLGKKLRRVGRLVSLMYARSVFYFMPTLSTA